MRVVHVDNLQICRYGRLKVSTGRKLFHGMIRNNWRVCEFSERDIARYEAPLGIRTLGIVKANKRLVETCANFAPDLVKQCRAFQADDARRQAVAEAGHRHYHTHFCGARVAAFMADVTLGRELTHPYIWQDEIYR